MLERPASRSFLVASPRCRIAYCWLIFATVFFLPQEREEDQRILVLTFEALRLLGNAIVALSDLRLNLLGPVPRHLHVLRPFSHYAAPVTLPGAMYHHNTVQVSHRVGRSQDEASHPESQELGLESFDELFFLREAEVGV